MIKLLRAHFCRLSKDILFYIVMLVNTVLTILFANELNCGIVDSVYLIIQPFIYSVFVAFFVGKEYGNGTIRNKLICGHTRSVVYFSYLITCIIATLASVIPGVIVLCAWNIKFISAIELSYALLMLLGYLLLHCACCALFVAVGFAIHSKAVCVIVVILVAFSGMFLSEMTVQKLDEDKTLPDVIINADGTQTLVDGNRPNPKYVDGTPRKILYGINNFLPQSQISEYCSFLAKWYGEWEATNSVDTTNFDVVFKDSTTAKHDLQYVFFVNQIVLLALTTLIGDLMFRKKELK